MKHQTFDFGTDAARVVALDPRRSFFRGPDEGLDEIVVVTGGLIAITTALNVGRRSIVGLRYPGEAILAGGRAPGTGVAAIIRSSVTVSTAAVLSIAECLMMTQRHEAIAQVWLARQHLDADARLAHLLCETAIRSEQGTAGMQLPFTQQVMGEITGQTSVNVNRVLAELERNELIKRNGRTLAFLDWDELARLGGFRPDYLER